MRSRHCKRAACFFCESRPLRNREGETRVKPRARKPAVCRYGKEISKSRGLDCTIPYGFLLSAFVQKVFLSRLCAESGIRQGVVKVFFLKKVKGFFSWRSERFSKRLLCARLRFFSVPLKIADVKIQIHRGTVSRPKNKEEKKP